MSKINQKKGDKMTREIKFRAWDIKWEFMTAEISLKDLAEGFAGTYGEDKIVMQFTGLLDKNGKEIYEDDVVGGLLPNGDFGKSNVFWSYNGYQPFRYLNCRSEDLYILGNIYESPDKFQSEEEKQYEVDIKKYKKIPFFIRFFFKKPILKEPQRINCRCALWEDLENKFHE